MHASTWTMQSTLSFRPRTRAVMLKGVKRPPKGGTCFQKQRPVGAQSRRVLCADAAGSLSVSDPAPQSSPLPMMQRMWFGFRAVCFGLLATALAIPLFSLMVLAAPFVLIFDRYRRSLYAHINTLWAKLVSLPFYRVQIRGKENLPADTEPAVYVANHQSFMDIFALFFLDRPIKFISKTSVFLFPFFGWSMFLTGHVRLNRMDRTSQIKCLKDCERILDRGAPVVFFPEGTRSADKKIQPFKKGAFTIAIRTDVPVVPITLNGTGDLMPKGKELELRSGTIQMTVHPRMESKGRDATELCAEAQAVIASALSI